MVFVSLIASSIYSSAQPLRIGYGNFPPYNFQNADHRPAGFQIDVLNRAARRSGINLEWIHSPEAGIAGLPSDEEVLARVNQITKDLMALKLAPVMEPYTGPVVSPRATGVFFHEIFGHRIEGQRAKNEDDCQTFKDKAGQKILPEFLSVYSDTTLTKLGKTELSGCYRYDNQGIKAHRVSVVEKGILKNYLMSRTPIEGFAESNGHGRRQAGYNVEARQSNLIIVASEVVSREELKKKLIDEVTKAKLPYGLFFDDVQGGFTFPGRKRPNSFTVIPVMTYRIYRDGREELVRGVDLIGTPSPRLARSLPQPMTFLSSAVSAAQLQEESP